MFEHIPDVDKIDKIGNVFSYLLGLGVLLGGGILGLLGYRRSKPASESQTSDPRDMEIARLQKEVDSQKLIGSIEIVMKATRESLYFKLDQGFSGIRADIDRMRAQLGAQIEDSKNDLEGRINEIERVRRSSR